MQKMQRVCFFFLNSNNGDYLVNANQIQKIDQSAIPKQKFTPFKIRASSIQTENSLDLSEITEKSFSVNEGAVKETMVKLTQQQVMNNYLSSLLTQKNAFLFLENIIIELTRIFEYVSAPSIYV